MNERFVAGSAAMPAICLRCGRKYYMGFVGKRKFNALSSGERI